MGWSTTNSNGTSPDGDSEITTRPRRTTRRVVDRRSEGHVGTGHEHVAVTARPRHIRRSDSQPFVTD